MVLRDFDLEEVSASVIVCIDDSVHVLRRIVMQQCWTIVDKHHGVV